MNTGYIVIPVDDWYKDERLNDGDVLLLAYLYELLIETPEVSPSSLELLFISRKQTTAAVDKQLKKLHGLGYINKTTKPLLGGGKQRIISMPQTK